MCKEQTQSLMKCLTENDNLEIALYESDLTVGKALNGTMINKLTKTNIKETIKTLVLMISRMNDHFNASQKLNQEQIITLALDLTDVFKYETLEDVLLMFKYARQGKIGGKVYKLDSSTIFNEWVPDYLELKAIEREKKLAKERAERMKLEQETSSNINDKVKDILNSFKVTKKTTKHKKTYYNNYLEFIDKLPVTCVNLTDDELIKQIKLAEFKELTEAVEIYKNELNKRKTKK